MNNPIRPVSDEHRHEPADYEVLKPCPNGCTTAVMCVNAAEGWHVRYVLCGCGWRSQEYAYRDPLEAERLAITAWNTRPAQQDTELRERGRLMGDVIDFACGHIDDASDAMDFIEAYRSDEWDKYPAFVKYRARQALGRPAQ